MVAAPPVGRFLARERFATSSLVAEDMDGETHRLFRLGLRSDDAQRALYDLAKQLVDRGVGQPELLLLFSWYQQRISQEDPVYDAIADNMDLIESGPWAKGHGLFPHQAGLQYESAESPYREPWFDVSPDDPNLEAEAAREIGPDHILWKRGLRTLARRRDRDDVLFAIRHAPEVCVVHLTWSGAREPSGFPTTQIFPSLLDWCDANEEEPSV